MKDFIKLLSIFLVIFVYQVCSSTESKLKLDSTRKYQNLLIHIDDDVQENDGKLLGFIQAKISLASKSLYTATNDMDMPGSGVQFGTVYVNVPNHWKINAPPATWQQSRKSQFIITTKEDNSDSDKPYTKQSNKCGEPGEFSRFSDSFFNNKLDLLRNGKEIMREFVKLRYGVYSEEPHRNILFPHNGTHLINGSCNQNILWEVNEPKEICSDKNDDCEYKIVKNQTHDYSVMFDAETPSSEHFCNDNGRPHNSLAYNLQNINCQGQSITTVILKHSDFKQISNEGNGFEEPKFKIVKQPGRSVMFALDTSGSMYKDLNSIQVAVQMFIKSNIESSAEVGIVTFNEIPIPLSPLVKMNSEANRDELVDKLKYLKSHGFTDVASGLLESVKLLSIKSGEQNREFKSIILITDGGNFDKENGYDEKLFTEIQNSNISVNVIFFGPGIDDQLSKLTKLTGGTFLDHEDESTILEIIKKVKRRGKSNNTDQDLKQDIKSTGYGNKGKKAGYGSKGKKVGYGSKGKKAGYGNKGKKAGYGNKGKKAGYGNKGKKAGYGNKGKKAGYGNKGKKAGYGNKGKKAGYGNKDNKAVSEIKENNQAVTENIKKQRILA